jgi:hypothetical protein
MFLCELIYYSRANEDITEEDLDSILEVAKHANKKRFITGALLLHQGYFVQCVEGHRDILNQLYSSIIRDARHSDVRLVRFRTIEERTFDQWHMGKADGSLITQRLTLHYSPDMAFNPALLSPEQLYRILSKLLK